MENEFFKDIEEALAWAEGTHCAITVSRNKKGRLQYVLRDLNSNTGTFVDNVELKQGERRNIEDGCLFTLGATSIILRSADSAEE